MNDGRLYMESLKEKLIEVYQSNKNLIVDGTLSSGKTTNILFPIVDKMINNNESIVVIDSKEEYINYYYEKLKEKNYNIVILNLRDLNKGHGWNPLKYSYDLYRKGEISKATEYLNKLANTIFYVDKNEDPFWPQTASNYFVGIVLGLFGTALMEEINFSSINTFLSTGEERSGLNSTYSKDYFSSQDVNSLAYINASATVFAPQDTKASILSVCKQRLNAYMLNENVIRLQSKTTFNYDDIITKPSAIFVIAKDEDTSLNGIASAFIEHLYQFVLDHKSSIKFNFVLDNIDVVEQLNNVRTMLSSAPYRGVKFLIGTRSLEGLYDKYGKYLSSLSNLISIHGSTVDMILNDIKETFDVTFEHIPIKTANIEFPTIGTMDIKTFDLKGYVIKKKELRIDEIIKNNQEKNFKHETKGFDAKAYIKRIDSRIEELEAKEQDTKEKLIEEEPKIIEELNISKPDDKN